MPHKKPVRVLGVDTSLRSTGVGIVDADGSSLRPVEFGVIRNPPERIHSECLRHLQAGIRDLLTRHTPDAAAVEGVFHAKNARTAMILGQARGVVLAACAEAGVPVYEYAPRRVKQALVGTGGAQKDQVARMVMSLLGLSEKPALDASDALAIAICHLHSRTSHRLLAPEQI